jgi:hypothetical protein
LGSSTDFFVSFAGLTRSSHGESVVGLLARVQGRGLLLLADEPEAGLSVTGQLAVLRRLHELEYVPLADVDPAMITATDHQTYCPYKGEASYWSLPEAENAVWGYQDPYDAVAPIKGHVAFYPDKAEVRIADRTAAS